MGNYPGSFHFFFIQHKDLFQCKKSRSVGNNNPSSNRELKNFTYLCPVLCPHKTGIIDLDFTEEEFMLNRRHLRVKVLQHLYAYFQSKNEDLASGEKELLQGIQKVYDLYLNQIMLLVELHHQEELVIEENRLKQLPDPSDLLPNMRFVENACLRELSSNEDLRKAAGQRKISWRNNRDLVRNLLSRIKQQNHYSEYMHAEDPGLHSDTRFVIKILNRDILPFELLHHHYEEKSIYWIDDWELINKMLFKTLKCFAENDGKFELMDLFKDASDKTFARELFKRTILNHEKFDSIISAKTKNWDVDRIAMMDMIIMEMALAEILKFSEIPVKVSLNEYIELSKMYSTPKSNVFVNGILDKLVEEFARDGIIPPYVRGESAEKE